KSTTPVALLPGSSIESTNSASTASVTDVNRIGISSVAFSAPSALGVELAKIKSTSSATKLSAIVSHYFDHFAHFDNQIQHPVLPLLSHLQILLSLDQEMGALIFVSYLLHKNLYFNHRYYLKLHYYLIRYHSLLLYHFHKLQAQTSQQLLTRIKVIFSSTVIPPPSPLIIILYLEHCNVARLSNFLKNLFHVNALQRLTPLSFSYLWIIYA